MSDAIDQVDIFENDIELYTQLFCEKYGINDLTTETQNRFNACLSFIYKNVFKNTDILKNKPNINNEYNTDILEKILDIYINTCNLYSKEISINGFTKLTGIEYQTILYWSNKPSSKGFEIYKKLLQENENSNSDLLSNGKNPVGIMARLNHVHNWNMPGVTRETVKRDELQIADTKTAFEQFQIEQKSDTIQTVNDA